MELSKAWAQATRVEADASVSRDTVRRAARRAPAGSGGRAAKAEAGELLACWAAAEQPKQQMPPPLPVEARCSCVV